MCKWLQFYISLTHNHFYRTFVVNTILYILCELHHNWTSNVEVKNELDKRGVHVPYYFFIKTYVRSRVYIINLCWRINAVVYCWRVYLCAIFQALVELWLVFIEFWLKLVQILRQNNWEKIEIWLFDIFFPG